jgi:branched-chain amino acid transport system permease protein
MPPVDGLPGNAEDTGRFRLRHPLANGMDNATAKSVLGEGRQTSSILSFHAVEYSTYPSTCQIFYALISNLAHGELYMLGGYTVWYVNMVRGVNYWLAFLPALTFVITLGIILERYVFRRYRGSLLPSLIVSIGLILIFQTSVLLIADFIGHGVGFQAVNSPFTGSIQLPGSSMTNSRFFVTVVGLVSMLALLAFLRKTGMGKSIRASAQDPEAAAVLGINLNNNCVVVMCIACGLAVISGGILAPIYGLEPTMGFHVMLVALVVVVIGGMGSLFGAIIATFIVGFVDALTTRFLGPHMTNIGLYMVLLAILIVRPKGFFGYIIHAH